ncbi:MAG: hypothetical protein D6820_12315 [Lentisphaerae bacterium]|nr:MAG: hypothetical protein D6820_12315 [Lentisphaerota bacterium]
MAMVIGLVVVTGCQSTNQKASQAAKEAVKQKTALQIRVISEDTVQIGKEKLGINDVGGFLMAQNIPENQEIQVIISADKPFTVAQRVVRECMNVGRLHTKIKTVK